MKNKFPSPILEPEDIAAKKLKKATRKAKRKAKVQFELGKLMTNNKEIVIALQNRLEILKQDIESLNPRFNPLQIHTKVKWVEELRLAIAQLNELELGKEELVEEVH